MFNGENLRFEGEETVSNRDAFSGETLFTQSRRVYCNQRIIIVFKVFNNIDNNHLKYFKIFGSRNGSHALNINKSGKEKYFVS